MAGCEITNNFNRKVLSGEWRLGCEPALDHVYMSQEKVWLRGCQTSMITWSPSSKDWPSRVGGWRPAGIVLSMGPHPGFSGCPYTTGSTVRMHAHRQMTTWGVPITTLSYKFWLHFLQGIFLLIFLVMRDCSCCIWLCLSLKMKC